MSRAEIAHSFWNQFEPSIRSMFLNAKAEEIDSEEKKEIISYLPDLTMKTVLELGSGIGRYTGYFAKQAKQVTTVDFISHFVEENKRKHSHFSNIDFVCKDVMDLEFDQESFDFVFINWLFMYLDDEEVRILAQRLTGWLRKKGILFFRESCAAKTLFPSGIDPAIYRTLHFYTQLFHNQLTFVREDSVKVSIQTFANPFQCFWIFLKK